MRELLLGLLLACAPICLAQSWNPAPPVLPTAEIGQPYSVQVELIGTPTPVVSYIAKNGSVGTVNNLPPGLTLSPSGLLTGTPTAPTNGYNFEIQADTSGGQSHSIFYGLAVVNSNPPAINKQGGSGGGCVTRIGFSPCANCLALLVSVIAMRSRSQRIRAVRAAV